MLGLGEVYGLRFDTQRRDSRVLHLPSWWPHVYKQKAFFPPGASDSQFSPSLQFGNTLILRVLPDAQHVFMKQHFGWLQLSCHSCSPRGLPASALRPRPCRCHALCTGPKEGTQPYLVPSCNYQPCQSPEARFTQAPRSLAASSRCFWILSGLPWARNLVWNSFSLQNVGSSASGAI